MYSTAVAQRGGDLKKPAAHLRRRSKSKTVGERLLEVIENTGFAKWPIEDKFARWFLEHYYGSQNDGVDVTITNARGDGAVDALVRIPETRYSEKRVCVVVHCTYAHAPGEGKKPTPLGKRPYTEFGDLPLIFDEPATLSDWLGKNVDVGCQKLYLDVLTLHRKGQLELRFLLVTLHTRNETNERRAIVKSGKILRPWDFVYAQSVFDLYERSLHGGTPIAGPIKVGIELGTISEYVSKEEQRYKELAVRTYIAVAVIQDLIDEMNVVGESLFSENIRTFKGQTDINKGIVDTFTSEPEQFFFGHNGIVIVCTDLIEGATTLEIINPSIINGSQTLHALRTVTEVQKSARVLLRIIRVPEGKPERQSLVSNLIERSNSQNPIRPWELRANDETQVQLEGAFARQGLYYERKSRAWRQSPSLRQRFSDRVEMVRLAQVLAVCEIGPQAATKVADIFSGGNYSRVFRDEYRFGDVLRDTRSSRPWIAPFARLMTKRATTLEIACGTSLPALALAGT